MTKGHLLFYAKFKLSEAKKATIGYTLQTYTGYLTPDNFGPVRRQNKLRNQELTRLSISYVTEKNALAALLPEPVESDDEHVLAVYCQVDISNDHEMTKP